MNTPQRCSGSGSGSAHHAHQQLILRRGFAVGKSEEEGKKINSDNNKQHQENATSHNSAAEQQHWMPTRWRTWLDDKARDAWLDGVAARASNANDLRLQGRGDMLREAASKQFDELFKKHASKYNLDVPGPERTHVQAACMAIATTNVLKPWVGEAEAHRLASEHVGRNAVEEAVWGGMLATAYFLSPSKRRFLKTRARLFALDHGSVLDANVKHDDDEGTVSIHVTRCVLKDIMQGDDQLLTSFCCGAEASRFHNASFVNRFVKTEHRVSDENGDGGGGCHLSWRLL
ncbi:hypothetical protein RI054_03g16890 [Pseudoscourfieldia marina]